MFGSVAGDIIGSVYEWNNIKRKDFPLFLPNSRFTDDTVMSCALANALKACGGDKEVFEKKCIFYMQQLGRKYIDAGYGGRFIRWILSERPQPYNSYGNGSAMRVAPVGFWSKTLDETLEFAKISAAVTHNHPDGIAGAQAAAGAVFLAKIGKSKSDIKRFVEKNFYSLDFSLDEIRESYSFDVTCKGSVPQAIVAFLESESYEDAVRNAVSIGGDSDTIACITGGVADAFYNRIPNDIKSQVINILPSDLLAPAEYIDTLR